MWCERKGKSAPERMQSAGPAPILSTPTSDWNGMGPSERMGDKVSVVEGERQDKSTPEHVQSAGSLLALTPPPLISCFL